MGKSYAANPMVSLLTWSRKRVANLGKDFDYEKTTGQKKQNVW